LTKHKKSKIKFEIRRKGVGEEKKIITNI